MGDERISDQAFSIDHRPVREFDRSGSPSVHGGMEFQLSPARSDVDARAAVRSVLEDERYVVGDWFDLPQPVHLVHDREAGGAFRVAVRGNTITFAVLPSTTEAALETMHRRLVDVTESTWEIEREVLGDQP